LARRKPQRVATRNRRRSNDNLQATLQKSPSKESIKAAEDLTLAAFASGLKLAAAFGTVAAKTTSFALESIATGADKFSELLKQEALKSQKIQTPNTLRRSTRVNRKTARRKPKRELTA
jgi:hypothetical protein